MRTSASKEGAFMTTAEGKPSNGKENVYKRDENDGADEEDMCCLPMPIGTTNSVSASSSSLPKQKQAQPVSRRSSLPKPKKLLFGCANAEEHYQYIVDACKRIEQLRGAEGLRELGFEYRMVHDPFNCQCEGIDLNDVADIGPGSTTFDELDPRLWEEDEEVTMNDNDSDDENEYTQPLMQNDEEEYMVPIGMPLADVSTETATTNISVTSDEVIPQDNNSAAALTKSTLEGLDSTLTTSPSNVSLFSLATHHTWTSGENREGAMELEHGCALRLVHVPPPELDACRPPTLIEVDNYETFIANGKMYDEVARLCMEYSQDLMMDEGHLEWVTVCEERSISALISRGFRTRRRPTLLIITGKGKVGAGIFSRRFIITSGIECSTALPMIREAQNRNMNIVILDPNARGDSNGMDTVDASLRHLFGATTCTGGTNDNSGEKVVDKVNEGVYIIAHSMAGAQICRYLHGDKQVGTSVCSVKEGADVDRMALFHRIKAVAFTDGNHNINWMKTNPELTAMMEGSSCLYVKSHKLHSDEPKELGTLHHDCSFWTHRFGKIRTIWAGTHEHALTNFTARRYIWDHFDSFLGEGGHQEEQDGTAEEYEDEKVPSF